MDYFKTKIKTPVGELTLVGSANGLRAVLWENDKPNRVQIPKDCKVSSNYPLFLETEKQLSEYFVGSRKAFDLLLDLDYGTDFQKSVWSALSKIPYGKVETYKSLAKKDLKTNAFRALGSANGKNPLSIIIPCHRVIASDGGLGGFAGGLSVKKFLLELEQKY